MTLYLLGIIITIVHAVCLIARAGGNYRVGPTLEKCSAKLLYFEVSILFV